MTNKPVLTGLILAATGFGLIVPRMPIHADASATLTGKPQVQVKFEWVTDQSPAAKTLTLSTTEDTTGTVALEPDGSTGGRASATIQPHVNADNTITVRFTADCVQSGQEQQVTTSRILRPG